MYSELTSRIHSYFIIVVLKGSILYAYKPVAVQVLVFMCTQLTDRAINVRTRIEKDKIVVLFASSTFFYLFFFESYEKCKQKM